MSRAAILLVLSLAAASSALRMPTVVDSNMVLQRAPHSANVWGFANASETVTVTLDGKGMTAKPVDGVWQVSLPPQEVRTGVTISISSTSGQTVKLANIAFGDVYLCSGQSNMEFSVNTAFNATAEIADSANYPNLRLFTVAKTPASTPQNDCQSKSNYTWAVSGPAAMTPVGGASFSWFSATCYFFGRDVYRALGGKVPIGLVASDWGGQKVEAFSSPDALNDTTCGGTVKPSPVAVQGSLPPAPNPASTTLWYGMIYPLLRMRFSGATWYQGEANAGDPASYACRFPAMITDWRKKMNLTLPFYFVELAAYPSSNFAFIREAQLAALKLDNVGFATAIDIGDPTSPEGSIHPRRKQEVGRRLSLNAQYFIYKQKVQYLGPTMKSWTLTQDKSTKLWHGQIEFTEADNLHAAGTGACTACCDESPFQIGDGTLFARANFSIDGSTVNIVANFTGQASQVLYAFEAYPQCSLYNGKGGPDNHTGIAAPPFRTPPPPPANRTLVFRQTWPNVFTPQEWSLNGDDNTQEMYSQLNNLENYRSKQNELEFKLVWPMAHGYQHWKQSSNPVTSPGKVTGYMPINVSSTDSGWAGLAADSENALLDGSWASGDETEWWYAVGSYQAFDDSHGHTGIPAYGGNAYGAVELYVRNVRNGWTLMLRQSGGYFQSGQFSLNAENPNSDMYAVLDTLEQFRDASGNFEFLLLWPDTYNLWRQTSNPVTTKGAVAGYSPIKLACSDDAFGGLEHNEGGQSLLDGSIGSTEWYYAVGDYGTSTWGQDGIPACSSLPPQMMAELYVTTP